MFLQNEVFNMIFSERLQNLPVQFFSTLVNKVNKAIAEGRDIINLGQGNPDQPTPSHIVKALQTAAEDPGTHKYSLFRGLPDLKKAAADFYQKQYGVTIDPETEVAILIWDKNRSCGAAYVFAQRRGAYALARSGISRLFIKHRPGQCEV